MRILPSLGVAAALGALLANSVTAATITGRVVDAQNKIALAGARIALPGTSIEVFTDQTGHYEITGIPAGTQTLSFSYVGFPAQTETVVLSDEQILVKDFAFGASVVVMDDYVISERAVGSARAINQQRAAETLTHFVAADAIGRFPDQNAAESLQRVPGLSLYRDQGEGRFIIIRGVNSDLNSVQLNGVSMASPERGSRTMALDILPSDAIGSIEVTKVPTPDQPADGIGGLVNMRTRSAFDYEERTVNAAAQVQYNSLVGSLSPKFNATYVDFLNNGKVGLTFSPTWQRRSFGSNNFEEDGGWTLTSVPNSTQTEYFFNGLAFREYLIVRTRSGLNSAIEYKPNDSTLYYVRGTWSKFTDEESRYVTFIPFNEGTLTSLGKGTATVTNLRRERHDLRTRKKDQEAGGVVAGGEFNVSDWKLRAEASYSEGVERRPGELTYRWRKSARGSTWTYSFEDGLYAPKILQTAGPDINSAANASVFNEISRLRLVNSPGRDIEKAIKVDASHDFSLATDLRGFVKAGGQIRLKDKGQSNETLEYSSGNTFPANITYAGLVERQSEYPFFGGTRANSALAVANFYAANLKPTRLLAESTTADWESAEDVYAAYLHAGVSRGPAHLSLGARYEKTKFSTSGNELVDGTTVLPVSASRSYDNWLPGIYGRYVIADRTVLRASISSALSRPAFEETAIARTVTTTTTPDKIAEGNPRLKALTATNYDVSIEHYFKTLGMVSAGAFEKHIDDYTYQILTPSTGPDVPEITTFANGNSGKIRGIELAWEQNFRFLPAPFDGLGLHANYTITDSSANYVRSVGSPVESSSFIGQSDRIGNLALSYEKGGFFFRAALNYRSPRLREDEPIGPTAAEDRYVDTFKQLDLTASYRLNKNLELFVEALNVTNEPFRVVFGPKKDRLAQFEEYGWSANFGVRLSL